MAKRHLQVPHANRLCFLYFRLPGVELSQGCSKIRFEFLSCREGCSCTVGSEFSIISHSSPTVSESLLPVGEA